MTEKEYDEKFQKYLKEQGPNPGTTFFGSWGWYATKKNEFNAMLKDDGIIVKDENGQNGSEERA
jgi:hypothetical protein